MSTPLTAEELDLRTFTTSKTGETSIMSARQQDYLPTPASAIVPDRLRLARMLVDAYASLRRESESNPRGHQVKYLRGQFDGVCRTLDACRVVPTAWAAEDIVMRVFAASEDRAIPMGEVLDRIVSEFN